jgi:KDO2-lipid IV(A) lauroyltransferase
MENLSIPEMSDRWKKVRYGLELIALRFAFFCVPLLPRRACVALAKVAGLVAARVDRAGWRVSLSNLDAAFGHEFSPNEKRTIAKQSYQFFAATMLDLLWSARLTRDNYQRYIDLENLERMHREIGDGPCIFACCHYGNFEWLSLAAGFAGIRSHIVAQQFKNASLDSLFNHLREQSGHQIVPRAGAVARLYRALRKGGRMAILVDLTLRPNAPAVPVCAFGLQTSMTFAHAWLQARTGAPIVPVHAEPLPHGRCKIVFHPKLQIAEGTSHREIAQQCWDAFEPIIRARPAPWLWMYKHWRYRPSDADRAYPFYANVAPGFDALLAQKSGEDPGTTPLE